MKLKIDIDLEWLSESGELDEQIKGEIIEQVINKITTSSLSKVEQTVNALITSRVESAVGNKLNECLTDFLTRPRVITDKWGDRVKTDVSVIDLLKESCDKFLDQPVDKKGQLTSSAYDKQTRLNWIIDSKITSNLELAVNRAANEATKRIKEHVENELKAQLGENVAKIIGLQGLVEKIK